MYSFSQTIVFSSICVISGVLFTRVYTEISHLVMEMWLKVMERSRTSIGQHARYT